MRRIVTFSGVFFLAFIIGVTSWFYYFISGYGWVREQWETSNGTFKVRVQNYESFPFFKSSYYVFQSSPAGSDSWREIVAYSYDGFEITIPMPREQVRFVNNAVGYFFMEWVGIAVTTDGGRTWAIWQPKQRELGVENVIINPDGTGVATFWSYDRQLESRIYHTARTNDYGRHWSFE